MEGIAKCGVSRKSFFIGFGVECLSFFGRLGSRFSGFLGLENRLENRWIFVMQTDPAKLGWRGKSTGYLGPSKDIKA